MAPVRNDRVFDTETARQAFAAAGFRVDLPMSNVDYEWFQIKKDGVGLQIFCNTGPQNRTRPVFYGGSRMGVENDGGMTLTDANLRVLREATKVYDELYKAYTGSIGRNARAEIENTAKTINNGSIAIISSLNSALHAVRTMGAASGLIDIERAKQLRDQFQTEMDRAMSIAAGIKRDSEAILQRVTARNA